MKIARCMLRIASQSRALNADRQRPHLGLLSFPVVLVRMAHATRVAVIGHLRVSL